MLHEMKPDVGRNRRVIAVSPARKAGKMAARRKVAAKPANDRDHPAVSAPCDALVPSRMIDVFSESSSHDRPDRLKNVDCRRIADCMRHRRHELHEVAQTSSATTGIKPSNVRVM